MMEINGKFLIKKSVILHGHGCFIANFARTNPRRGLSVTTISKQSFIKINVNHTIQTPRPQRRRGHP